MAAPAAANTYPHDFVGRLALKLKRAGFDRDVFLLCPVLIFVGLFFGWPFVEIASRSLYKGGITFEYYRQILFSGIYFKVFVYTFEVAAAVTLASALVSFPIAFVMSSAKGIAGKMMILCVTMPLMTSAIVRSFAWIVMVGRESSFSLLLQRLGIVSGPPELLYNKTSVIVGMTYIMVPFMTLTLYGVMRGIDQNFIKVSYSLGASRWFTFRRIYFPLCLPGLVGGAILVFVMSLGFYVTPALMGGPSDVMIAMIIAREVEVSLNWPLAAAMATVLLCVTSIAFSISAKLVRVDRLLGSKI